MKTFDEIRISFNEMAKKVTTPSRLTIDSKYNRNTQRDKKSGLPTGQNLFLFYEMIKKKKTLPFFMNLKTPKKRGTGVKTTQVTRDLKIMNHSAVLKQIELAGQAADPVVGKGSMTDAKRILDKIVMKTKEGDMSLYDIDHKKLGFKNTGLSGGGENQYNQALQCVISACAEQKIYPSPSNASKIAKYVDIGEKTIEEVLRVKSMDWLKSASATHRALRQKFGSFKKHKFVEESSTMSGQIYSHMKKVFKSDGVAPPANDRWNPADMWIVSNSFKMSEITSTTSIQELNEKMVELFDSKKLMGVSLKKSGGGVGSIKMVNHPTDDEGFTYYKFKSSYSTKITSVKPVGVMKTYSWDSTKDDSVQMHLTTYGAKNDPKPRMSAIRFGLLSPSGGQQDGTVMGENVARITKPYFTYPSFKEVEKEFMEGYSSNSTAFWKKFTIECGQPVWCRWQYNYEET